VSEPIVVIGVPPEGIGALPPGALSIIRSAATLAAGRRHLAALEGSLAPDAQVIPITADLQTALGHIGEARARGSVVVVASGDPGFFGIGRLLADRFGSDALEVHPAASSIAAAFGRVGIPWDDAVIASAHGRPLPRALDRVLDARKAAVLTSPENPPEKIGAYLKANGGHYDHVVVISNLGHPDEAIERGDSLEWLAQGSFPRLSVVLLVADRFTRPTAVTTWPPTLDDRPREFGRHEDDFEHGKGLITRGEARAVVLGRLALSPGVVLWDVGAGSGSIGIEASLLVPSIDVFAIERNEIGAARIAANARRHGVRIRIAKGEAPAVLDELPDPDRVVVGGGGLPVLEEVLKRLKPGGRAVATFASLERAVTAADWLGNLVQVSVSRGVRLPDGAFRLSSLDPVFICWGP
jgi:precorrin-6Y C5,15-methyltransferase (decarboxylating)